MTAGKRWTAVRSPSAERRLLFLPVYIKELRFILLVILLFSPPKVSAIGIFEDVTERAMNLVTPMKASLQSGFLRAEYGEDDISAFFLGFSRPLGERFLLGFRLSYVVMNDPEGMRSNFGDLIADLRTDIFRKANLLVFLTTSFRTGSGSRDIYPYASGSMDIRAGVGVIDSLALFTVWGEVTKASVHKAPKNLARNRRHGNFETVSAGLILPLRDDLSLFLGAEGYHLAGGGTRELYSGGVKYVHSPEIELFMFFQAEGGAVEERVCDRCLRMGVRVYY